MTQEQLKRIREQQRELSNAPTYEKKEQENREWYIPSDIKNKTAFKLLLAGVSIIGAISILQSFFH